MRSTINSILSNLQTNASIYVKYRWSGMAELPDCYRIHESKFLPQFMNVIGVNKLISDEIDQFPKLTWDSESLWLTIKK